MLAKPDLKVEIEKTSRFTYRCENGGHYYTWQVELLVWNKSKNVGRITNIQLHGEREGRRKSSQPLDDNVGHRDILYINHQLSLNKLPRTTPLFKIGPEQMKRISLLFLPNAGPDMLDFCGQVALTVYPYHQDQLELKIDPQGIEKTILEYKDYARPSEEVVLET